MKLKQRSIYYDNMWMNYKTYKLQDDSPYQLNIQNNVSVGSLYICEWALINKL